MIFIRLLFIALTILAGCWHSQEQKSELHRLLSDMQLYKLVSANAHQGDLLEHSIWALYAAAKLTNEPNYATQNLVLSEQEKKLVQLGALLHDIGKAGQCSLFENASQSRSYAIKRVAGQFIIEYKSDNREHTLVGYNYIAQPKTNSKDFYCFFDKSKLNVKKILKEARLTDHEHCILALMIGMHWELGAISKNLITIPGYIDKAKMLWKKLKPQKNLTPHIIRLCILVQMADMLGIEYNPPRKTLIDLPSKMIEQKPVRPPQSTQPIADQFEALPLDPGSTCSCAKTVQAIIKEAEQKLESA